MHKGFTPFRYLENIGNREKEKKVERNVTERIHNILFIPILNSEGGGLFEYFMIHYRFMKEYSLSIRHSYFNPTNVVSSFL